VQVEDRFSGHFWNRQVALFPSGEGPDDLIFGCACPVPNGFALALGVF